MTVSVYSLTSAGRREAFGLLIASQDSACNVFSVSICRVRAGSRVLLSAKLTAALSSATDRIAGFSASRYSRSDFSVAASIMTSPFNVWAVVARSVRRLCIALNAPSDASAMTDIRPAACSRPHEPQAVATRKATTQPAMIAITALSSAEMVKRLSLRSPDDPGVNGAMVKIRSGDESGKLRVSECRSPSLRYAGDAEQM